MGSHPAFTTGWVHNLETAPASTDAGLVIAIALALSILAILSVALRFVVRWRLVKALGLDDYAALASMLLGIGYSIVAIYQTRWGLGLNVGDFPLINAVSFSRVQYSGGPIYCLAILGFKVSLLASYLRWAGFNQLYRYVLYTVLALVITNQLIYTFLLSFACRPIAKQWNPALPGVCIDQLATYFGLGGSSLGFDALIIVLPFPILRRLQLNTKKKVMLGCLLALGFFVSIIQIARINTIAKLATYTDSKPVIIWSLLEINLGVFISCVPSFAPLLKRVGEKVTQEYQYHSNPARRHSRIRSFAGSSQVVQPMPAKRDKRVSLSDIFTSKPDTSMDQDEDVEYWASRQAAAPLQAYIWSGDGGQSQAPFHTATRDVHGEDGHDSSSRNPGMSREQGRQEIMVEPGITVERAITVQHDQAVD